MATVGVLERREKKAYVDDTIPLTAIITTYKVLPSHAEYIIRVQRGPNPEESWEVGVPSILPLYHNADSS